jgi:NADH:ubiquinone oxidoreductase subunit 6 (subunit J)
LLPKLNWFGIAGGITIILLIAISLFVPWWQLTVGDSLIAANVSPLYTNFELIGNSFTIPLLWAINLASILYLTAGGIVMLIYSIKPTKSYSKRLLGFSYRKPLYFVVFFVIGLVALTLIIQTMFNLSVSLMGSNEIALPSNMTQGVNISVLVSAGFLWPFWLAVVSAGLCVAARLYHKRIVPPTPSTASLPETTTVAPPTAPTV